MEANTIKNVKEAVYGALQHVRVSKSLIKELECLFLTLL